MEKAKKQSVEPNIVERGNGWLKEYKLDYKLEQEKLNTEIDNALSEYKSKAGKNGGNRPDSKILLQDKNTNYFPILIEYKGYENSLIKLNEDGQVENQKKDGSPNYENIKKYAVNGAIHYANALIHHTNYTDIISIGMTGYKDKNGELKHSIGVYYVSKNNLGVGQKVGDYIDFSFLNKENFDDFIEKVKHLNLSKEELEKIKQNKEEQIEASLKKLNEDIYQKDDNLSEADRVYLVCASIIATLGVPNEVEPLDKRNLQSKNEDGNRDGDIIIRKIKAFLNKKNIQEQKKERVLRTFQDVLLTEKINKPENGESQLKRIYSKIIDDLGIYYKIGLTTDFTGKLFNVMYDWLGFTQDKLNDVVLTPSYVSKLLVKLAKTNKNSYVWDFATGSGGLLVSAMNEMINDAKDTIKSPEEYQQKLAHIKSEQLLGIEVLPNISMLAILNMIIMGDGTSKILNEDSLSYEFEKDENGKIKEEKIFPADVFILNPPYSKEGNGMIFVEKALGMMKKGYGAIIIQSSAGTGRATKYNKEILKNNTLIASIKMPPDLFGSKASVQTHIYVFKVGESHDNKQIVKFIDFKNDGYKRTNRKKSMNVSNLKDVNNAKERYEEVVNLVHYGEKYLKLLSKEDYYENTIDKDNGNDWNQTKPIDTKPTLADFKKTIADYLDWEVSQIKDETNHNMGK